VVLIHKKTTKHLIEDVKGRAKEISIFFCDTSNLVCLLGLLENVIKAKKKANTEVELVAIPKRLLR